MLNYGSDGDDRLINGPSENTYSSVGRNNRISRSEDNEYTELLRGSVPCPTCRGLGNVPKGMVSLHFCLFFRFTKKK